MKVRTINEDFELRKKKRKKNQLKIKRMVFLVKFVLTAGLIVATTVLLALSPLFEVNRIEVRGAVHYSPERLVGMSGAVKGLNGFKQAGGSPGDLLTLRLGGAEKRIMQGCPYVKKATVRFVPPGTIVIDITERTPAAVLPYEGTSLLVDREGVVLEVLEKGAEGLPLIKGLEFGSFKLGAKPDYRNSDALDRAFGILEEIRALDKNETDKLYTNVDSIDASDPESVVISLDKRIRVKLGGNEDLNYRLSTVRTIFYKNIKKEDKGILDFTSGENPVFTTESGG